MCCWVSFRDGERVLNVFWQSSIELHTRLAASSILAAAMVASAECSSFS